MHVSFYHHCGPTCHYFRSDAILVLLSVKGGGLKGDCRAGIFHRGVNEVFRQCGTFVFTNSLVELNQFGLVCNIHE